MAMAAMIGAQVVGTGFQLYGQSQQIKATRAAANYNEAVALRQAALEERASLEEQHIARNQARQYLKQMKADMIARGGQPNLSLLLDAASNMEADIQTAALNRSETIQNLTTQAAMEKYSGKQAVRAGKIGMWGTLFGSAASIGSQMYMYNKLTAGVPKLSSENLATLAKY